MRILFALLVCGCNLGRFTVGLTAPIVEKGMRSMDREGDLELARNAAAAQLKTADGMLETDPENQILLRVVARGYLEYAFGFVEDDLEAAVDPDVRTALTARATSLYERSLFYAMRLLERRHHGITRALERGDLTRALAACDQKDVAGLTYSGMALASIANLNRGDFSRVADLPKAVALLERARALDPRFYHGGAAMALGLVYGSEDRANGGQPRRARKLLEEAIAVDGGRYFMPRVMLARAYAVAVHDRELFEKTLDEVLRAPIDALPDARLANQMARRRAARYRSREAALFKWRAGERRGSATMDG